MALCPSCYSTAVAITRVSISATEIGLPTGTLHGVEEISCPECGETTVSLPAHGAVVKEFRKQLAALSRPLEGAEFAYLRRSLGVTGRGYAEALGVTNVTISRVENAESVPALQDSLIRALTFLDVEAAGAIEKLASRAGLEVEVDVGQIEKSRGMDLLGGWKLIPEDGRLVGNVIPLQRPERREIDHFEFEGASNSDLYSQPQMRLA